MKSYLILAAASTFALPLFAASAQTQPQNHVGITRAVAVAEQRIGGTAFDAELEHVGGAPVYEVELAKEGVLHRVTVSAATGRVISATRPRAANQLPAWASEEMPRTANRTAPMLAALERDTNGKVRELSFDDDGVPNYEVEIATAAGVTELHLDPATGRRVRMAYDD
jgi:uncharacterized membrane protein YkoI